MTPDEKKEGKEEIEIGVERGSQSREELSELKELVDALRDSILELKATLYEMTSPLAGLRKYAKEEESEEVLPPVSALPAITSEREIKAAETLEGIGKPVKETVQPKAAFEGGKEERPEEGVTQIASVQETRGLRRQAIDIYGRYSRSEAMAVFRKAIKLLRLLYELSNSMPPIQIENYTKLLRTLGLLDDRISETISVLKDIVEVGRENGIDPEDQVIAIYSIAKVLGITDQELEEEIAFSLVERISRRNPRSSNRGQ
uniref:Uncharacterized protein n=1 Tax=Fervidicoccus fontis TaxID=683846 RepID=A0A7J3ZLU9_9CREN